VRIIAAASQDLKIKTVAGEFRQDLYYRLNVVQITLPPLRMRKDDIAVLCGHFLTEMNQRYNKTIKGFKDDTMAFLASHSWPGNIRELEHAIEQAVVLSTKDVLGEEDFSFLDMSLVLQETLFQPRPLQEALNDFKKTYIESLLQHTNGNQSQAAKILQIQRTYLNRLLKELSD
jgi:Nif-specific regulatory protein